jgi:transcriptional regulator with XRE-family HTH domain
VGPDEQRRRELGGFLRKRREALLRSDHDLPPVGRNRLTGLRREEIAYQAGVSVTWYTWLEQGRDINPSRQVLDALAVAMRLSVAEHEYLLSLAGYAPGTAAAPVAPDAVPAHLQRLIDAQGPSPAFALSPTWAIVAWNRAYEVLYPNVARVDPADRNLLLAIFTDPADRSLLPDWEITSRRFLAEYRAQAGPRLAQPEHVALVARLQDESPEFARAWADHRVERFASRERRFTHPGAGELVFEHHELVPADVPDVHVVVYLAAEDSLTWARMRSLLARGATGHDAPISSRH